MPLYHSEIIYVLVLVQISLCLNPDDQSSQVQTPELGTSNVKKPPSEEKSEVKGMVSLKILFDYFVHAYFSRVCVVYLFQMRRAKVPHGGRGAAQTLMSVSLYLQECSCLWNKL